MADTKEIVFVNYILDNVHGFIGLTEMENEIEALPIFKRLQDVSQLGLVKRIFPCALHNRYIHSLGVMHVIDQMALHLKRFNSAERQLLRLAGMLHDLGHYPLSHDIEQVYQTFEAEEKELSVRDNILYDSYDKIQKILAIETKIDPNAINIADIVKKPIKKLSAKKNYHHEFVTAIVIRKSSAIRNIIIDGIRKGFFNEESEDRSRLSDEEVNGFADKIINDICALIQGDGTYEYAEQSAFPRYFTAMIQLLHSEMDADRIDYLLRDATFTGASYGSFDVGVLLQNLDMRLFKAGKYEAWIVGVKEKGIGCADQYMINRYLAYTQVIFNKYTSINAKMLQTVAKWMMKSTGIPFYDGKQLKKIISIHEKDKGYLTYTDTYFFERLNKIIKGEVWCPEDVYYFVEKLKEFRSIKVEREDIFSGSLSHIQDYIKNSDFYNHVIELAKNDKADSEKSLYLMTSTRITDHIPLDDYKENFELYNKTHHKGMIYEEYLLDRMMDGLAVIYDDKDKEPVLLVDAEGSMMKEMYDVQQILLRKYEFPIETENAS